MSALNSSTAAVSQNSSSPFDIHGNPGFIISCVTIMTWAVMQYIQARKCDINVPAVGPSGRLTSYLGVYKYITDAKSLLREGYDKYKARTFKVPLIGRWLVIVNTPELMDEVRKAPDDKLSFREALEDNLAMEVTLGRLVVKDHYHVPIVRSVLTRNIGTLFDSVREEIFLGYEQEINATGSEWISRPALKTVMQVVCRASNRVFVGLPLCRDKDYIDLNIRFTIDVIKGGRIINMAPNFMRGFVGKFLTSVPASTRRAIKHMRPIIEYRLRQEEEHGKDWPDKPNDMLSWLLDEASGEQRTVKALTQRILTLNFAAIHTSSMSFTHALLHLAAHPEYIAPLREEVERVVASDGWSKASIQKMRKVDSFLKETQRYNGLGVISMGRKALVDYKLSDGTLLPAGTHVACNSFVVHNKDAIYADAHEFRPFRFADAREESTEAGLRNQMASTSIEYLPFGHGRHACPGRFFAVTELKTMLACIVLEYDIKLRDGEERPKDLNIGSSTVPNPTAHVLFRRRQA